MRTKRALLPFQPPDSFGIAVVVVIAAPSPISTRDRPVGPTGKHHDAPLPLLPPNFTPHEERGFVDTILVYAADSSALMDDDVRARRRNLGTSA